jgi:tRNA (uracil-5-)-methyltransferase
VYAYRTKITPHFERPPKYAKREDTKDGEQPSWLKIGFNVTNSNSTLDIEVCSFFFGRILQLLTSPFKECPIATSVLNDKYRSDRKEIAKCAEVPVALFAVLTRI